MLVEGRVRSETQQAIFARTLSGPLTSRQAGGRSVPHRRTRHLDLQANGEMPRSLDAAVWKEVSIALHFKSILWLWSFFDCFFRSFLSLFISFFVFFLYPSIHPSIVSMYPSIHLSVWPIHSNSLNKTILLNHHFE